MQATELERFRAALLEQREELRGQLVDLGANPEDGELEASEFDPGFADSAHSTAERGNVLALVDRLREQLLDVEKALGKMDAGTYGTCENCGNPISPERLEALPYSILCVTCKQRSV